MLLGRRRWLLWGAALGLTAALWSTAEGAISSGDDSSQDYLGRESCPLPQWFPHRAARAEVWADALIQRYRAAWERAGSPRGAGLNDHNHDTLLGQGNTLAFLAGRLTTAVDGLPLQYRVGLFSRDATHPVVVRFSDFGADDSPLRVGRMAVKVEWRSAWGGEVNLLFTETMDTFPLADHEGVAFLARDPKLSPSAAVGAVREGAGAMLLGGGVGAVVDSRDRFLLGKEYYSQVPYALGDQAAMRVRLVPYRRNAGTADTFVDGVREFISRQDAVFALEIQIHPDQRHPDVTRGASRRWTGDAATYHRVGTLTLPQQATDDVGTSLAVKRTLLATLQLTPAQAEAVHKLFAFHPLLTVPEHRPVGEVNAFRATFYARHAGERLRTLHAPLAGARRFQVPFAALTEDPEVAKLFEVP